MKYYAGIDNGLSGGIVIIDEVGRIDSKIVMPTKLVNKKLTYDIELLHKFFGFVSDRIPFSLTVCLEHSYVRPISGKRACFMTGFGYGVMQALLEANDIQYRITTPQKWMKTLGISSKEGKGSVAFCAKQWPDEDWRKSDRCRNAHDGLTDAAGIAEYARRQDK